MRQFVALVCFFTAVSLTAAQGTPKGKESGLVTRVIAVDANAVASITPESVPGYQKSSDGVRFTVLHIRNSGAAAVRVRFTDIRLPEAAALLVYGIGSEPAWQYTGGAEDAAVVIGDSAFIEVQCGVECPADLPFAIAEVTSVEAPSPSGLPAPSAPTGAKGITNFRGVDVEYELRDGLAIMEGDIVLGAADEMLPASGGKGRSKDAIALSGSNYRWPGGKIPYAVDYNVADQGRITAAAEHWNSMLAGVIHFVPRTNESVYLRVIRGNGCSAGVGMGWSNILYLGDHCSTGTVIHEFGHTVGLYHEHVRADRDRHVRILTENMLPSALAEFAQKSSVAHDVGAYDFNSIMHYSAYAASANGMPTIETIPAGIPIGQRVGLSAGDVAAVRSMYGYSYTPPPAPAPAPEPAPVPTPIPVPPPPAPAPAPAPLPLPAPEPTPAPAPAPEPEPTRAPEPTPVATPIMVTILANPASEQIVVDGVTYSGYASVQWMPGSSHTIGALNRSSSGSMTSFVRWSDDGEATHTVVASPWAPVYKVDYTLSHAVSVNAATPGGQVEISPISSNGYYPAYSSVQVVARPDYGYCFTGWTGLIGGTSAMANLAVTKPYSIGASFARAQFSLDRQVVYAGAAWSSYTASVSGPTGCSWTASSYSSWVRLTSAATGSGTDEVTYTVDANDTGATRIGVLVVAGNPVYVIQQP